MQRKLKSLLAVASLVAAAVAVFVACGGGDLKGLSLEEIEGIEHSGEQLGTYAIKEGVIYTECENENCGEPPLSSGEPNEPSSSSEEPIVEPSSSSQPPEPSSSSAPQPGASSSSLKASSSSTPSAPSSSSVPKSSSSPSQITSGCAENNAKSGFTCGWNVTGTLTPGTTLKPAAYTLPSGCSTVAWKFAPDTAMALIYECETLGDGGVQALGSKNYVLFAELTCDDGKHTTACNPKTGLSSKVAPVLTGKCEWAKNPTTTARGGTPSGVSVIDTDNVCGSTKSVVYKYEDGAKTWPATGILTEWKNWDKKQKETYNVEATLNCPAYPQTVTSPCDPLDVSAGTDYIIECTGDWQGSACPINTVTMKLDECVEINVLGLDKQHQNGVALLMRCDAQGASQNVSLTMSLGGKATSYTGQWSWNGQISLGNTKLGDNPFGTLCVTALSGATGVKCTLGQ